MKDQKHKIFLISVFVFLAVVAALLLFKVKQNKNTLISPVGIIKYEADSKLLHNATDYLVDQRIRSNTSGNDATKTRSGYSCKVKRQATDSKYLYTKMSCDIPIYDKENHLTEEKFRDALVRFEFDGATNAINSMDEPISVDQYKHFFPQEIIGSFE